LSIPQGLNSHFWDATQNAQSPDKLDVKQEVASAGLDPQIEQSGSSLDRSQLSKRGNPRIRKALYFPALSAIRFNPIVKEFYERLRSRGKAKMVAVCAAMRKLLHLVVGVLKNQAHFDPNW
jgi:transposase